MRDDQLRLNKGTRHNSDSSLEGSEISINLNNSITSVFKLPQKDLLKHRFHIVTGKGGVGKSTTALTLGMYFAQCGLKTLICEVDQREMMTQAFDKPASHSELRQLTEFLSVVNIDTQVALGEYGTLKLKVKALSSLLVENPLTRALLAVVPGVADLIALGKAFNHERECDDFGPIWDRIIVDAPSTGHGLTFMRLPQLIREVVPNGNMRKEADAMWELISNPSRSVIHIVTIPEEMPIQETLELWQTLKSEIGMTPQALWVNSLEPLILDEIKLKKAVLRSSLVAHDSNSNFTALNYLLQRQDEALNQRRLLKRLEILGVEWAEISKFIVDQPCALRTSIEEALSSLDRDQSIRKTKKDIEELNQ